MHFQPVNTVSQFLTPEAQARQDRVINTPSWGAFAFHAVYLASMRAWRHALAVLVALGAGIGLVTADRSLMPLAAVTVVGSWVYAGWAGKRIAWRSRQWRDLDHFLSHQRLWDRWGRVAVAVYLLVGVSVAGALLKEREPRVQALFFLTLALVVVSALRGTWRKLAPAAAPRSIALRGLLVAGWLAAYLAFILFIGVAAQDLGLEAWVTPGLLVVAWLVGTVTFVTGAATRFSRARHRGEAAASGGIWSFRALAGVVAEALTLPFRHPVTLLPFLFASGVAYLLRLVIHVEVPVPTDAASTIDVAALWKSLALSIGLNAPFFLFAANATTELVSQYECGLNADLRRAVRRAGGRLPAGLLAMLLQVIGLTVGAILLIIPALILFVRWIFVPHAIVLAQDNALQAFRTSNRVTAGHGWRVFLLLVLLGVWNLSLYRTLSMLPTIGSFLISWLDFSWLAVATTLLYLRGGGPYALSSHDAHLTQVV